MLFVEKGDILNSPVDIIAHQCNCITTHSSGLAKSIFNRYPYSDTYSIEPNTRAMGKIDILGNGIEERYIANLYAQLYPSKSKYEHNSKDGVDVRLNAFKSCLYKVALYVKEQSPNDITTIGVPFGIGCGLAGGNWYDYMETLIDWEAHYNFIDLYIFKL
jgi:O-acetyl-ADP-ribose deacetylase (regulator of RNase III)